MRFPNEFELGILDGVLTADQKMMFQAALRGTEEVQVTPATPTVIDIPNTVLVKEMAESGMKVSDIAKETGLSVVEVRGII